MADQTAGQGSVMAGLIPLSRWWQRPVDSPVAVQGDKVISAGDFQSRVSAWVDLLASHEGNRWAVFHSDAAECLAIVCALWQLSRTACIPGDNLPGTVTRLSSQIDGFVGQFNTPSALQLEADASVNNYVDWQMIADEHPAIEVYTSGSTGEPKAIKKSMMALQTELEALNELMPDKLPSVVISTVSHQHLYGMTFRLFRPFVHGQAFTPLMCEYPEDLIAQAQHYDSFSLISSPAHLGRLNQQLDWQEIKDKCVDIYSSAAPLSRADSMLVSQCLDAPVKEIYGSSETGAIAWRCQQHSQQDAGWQPLSYVALMQTENATLKVDYKLGHETVLLADKVAFDAQGHFALLGRADRIAKIEGKRVSLTELEETLQLSDIVAQAKTVMLTRQRAETAAVLILSEHGGVMLNQYGRKYIIKALKAFLSHDFEAVLIPRRWRFVDDFPYNQQGKVTLKNLEQLFAKPETKWPELIATQTDNGEVKIRCRLPSELIYFDGHFEQQGILPGIVQVHWAANYGSRYLPVTGRFIRIEALKFQQLLLPGQTVDMTLRYDDIKQKLFFSYESEHGVHSSGRICYG